MKKKVLAIVLTLVCLLMLASCGCKHQWIDPNCTAPRPLRPLRRNGRCSSGPQLAGRHLLRPQDLPDLRRYPG